MPYQLVVQNGNRSLRFPLAPGIHLIGSGSDADVRLAHPTISRHHARLRVSEGGLELEDVGSRNGTRVDGRRLTAPSPVEAGQAVQLGSVEARVETVAATDLVAAVRFEHGTAPDVAADGLGTTTVSTGSLRTFTLERLPDLLKAVEAREDPAILAQGVGAALFESLPCSRVAVTRTEPGGAQGLLFDATREGHGDDGEEARGHVGSYGATAWFAHELQARAFEPLLDAAARLVALADRRHRVERRPVPPGGSADPPRPPSVVPAVQAIYRDAARIGRGDVGVLITGESGTGKEVLARFLHRVSSRRDRPFVALNCAALPRDLLEAELLGVEEGVATGVRARPGKFELAHEGTLFLDEIGDMAAETQAKILRVLQEGEAYRLGGRQPRPAQVRVVAATNKDLDAMMADGSFRRDLYHRIADWRVELPPLRRRRADVLNLAAWFLRHEAERHGLRVTGISQAALEALAAYSWPGNIRQLEREMARAVLFLESGELLQSSHLQQEIRDAEPTDAAEAGTLADKVAALERRELSAAVARHAGNLSAASRDLGIARSTLYRRLNELGLAPGEG